MKMKRKLSETESDDAGNIIKPTFVDETNIPNKVIGEPNIVIDTSKSTNVSENNANAINMDIQAINDKDSIVKT